MPPVTVITTLITVALEDLPALVTFLRGLKAQPNLTPDQAAAYEKSADAILDSVIAWAKTPD